MDRQELLGQVRQLKGEGKSIRSIAIELGVHRSRVHRALKVLTSAAKDEMIEKSEPSSPGRLRQSVFIGRQQEMLELGAAVDDALSGHGQLVMLVGQPGIGKTRTSQELAVIAEELGAQVLWGRCYEGQGAPPYLALDSDYSILRPGASCRTAALSNGNGRSGHRRGSP